MAVTYRTKRIVEFCDTDMAGIMHFAAFFRYMESAEHELLRSWGFSIFDSFDGQSFSFPRVHAACEYFAPARSEDLLDITVAVERVGSKSIAYGFLFQRGEAEIARGNITCVCCRITAENPPESMAIPPLLAEKLRGG